MSPCSNGPTKIPSGATREEPGEVGLAHRERKGAHIVTVTGQHVEGVKLPLVIMLARVQRVEVGDAVDTEHDRLAVDDELLVRFFSADSTIQG